VPLLKSAHAVRAILFARATTTTSRCVRADGSTIHSASAERFRSACETTDLAPCRNILRKYSLPHLLMPSSLVFPPVECCLGTSPSHAERSPPLRKVMPLPMAATSAVETSGPKPGISMSRRHASSSFAIRCSSELAASIRASNSSHSCFSSRIYKRSLRDKGRSTSSSISCSRVVR